MNLIQRCKKILSTVSASPQTEARMLIEEITGKSPYLIEEGLKKEEMRKLRTFLFLRVKKRIPIQYLIGKVYFYDLEFKIRKGVFIPRPETESMIETFCDKIEPDDSFLFLDIGTGSGNIAITILKHFTNSMGVAVDISKNALILAKENAVLHKVIDRLSLILTDGTEGIKEGIFDFIFTNPPYIPTDVIEKLQPEIKKEPKIALDGGENGLKFIKRFLIEGYRRLKMGGTLFMEVGPETWEETMNLASSFFKKVESKKDLEGRQRIIVMIK